MSYTIKKTDGTTLAVVPENEVVSNAASVALVGRGATNYGLAHSQNFVQLLENFAHVTPPANALEGQLWWDKSVGAMKVRKGNEWAMLGSGGAGTGDGVAGSVFVQIGDTSVLCLIAGGKIIAVISPLNIPNSAIPVSVSYLSQTIPFQSRYPYGLEAGHNLAHDPEGYLYNGHVPQADAAVWTGGGNPFAATTFIDLGATSVALTISNNAIIAAYSQAVVANSQIPTNFSINNITMPFKSVFPNGLIAGLTLATNYGIRLGGGTISGGSGGDANALVFEIRDEFLSGTGQTTMANAISWLIATAGDGTANAEAVTLLRSEIRDAMGTVNFAQAMTKLSTVVNANYVAASDLTTLESNLTTAFGTAIATATSEMLTASDLDSAAAQVKTALEATFESATGYSSFASAVNDLKTIATGTGSVVSQDTDLRTQFTNAMAVGAPAGTINTIQKAFDKLKLYGGKIDTNTTEFADFVGRLKTLTGTGALETTSQAVSKLVSESKLNTAMAANNTSLKAAIAGEMVPGSVTIADAVTEIIQQASVGPDGSSSIIDQQLRNTFVTLTNEAEFPVTTFSEAITKLMSNTTKDRANTAAISELQSALTGATGTTTVANARTKLGSAVTKADAAALFETQLKAAFTTETGTSTLAEAIDRLSTYADEGHSASQKVTSMESSFKTLTGATNTADAIQTMWTRANASGATAAWGFKLDANGQIVGIQAVADSAQQRSEIAIQADLLKFVHPSSEAIVPFYIKDNKVYIKNLMFEDATIGTEKLQQMTFTTEVYRGSVSLSNQMHAIYNGQMTVSTGNVPAGSKIVIFFSCNVTGDDRGGMFANVVRQDGFYCQGTAEFGNPDEGGSAQSWTWTDTVPAAGTYTYTIYGYRFGGSSTIRNAHMIGMVQKQIGSTTGSGSGGTTAPPIGGGGYYDPGTGGYTGGGGGGGGGFQYESQL